MPLSQFIRTALAPKIVSNFIIFFKKNSLFLIKSRLDSSFPFRLSMKKSGSVFPRLLKNFLRLIFWMRCLSEKVKISLLGYSVQLRHPIP